MLAATQKPKTAQVHWKFTEVDYNIRPTNEMILDVLKEVRERAGAPARC